MKPKPTTRHGLVLLGASLVLAGASSGAVDISTATGNGADVTVINDGSGAPGIGSFEIRQLVGTRLRLGYLRFDISALAGQDLSGATITINGQTVNRNRPLNFRGVLDGTTTGQGENWDEGTITYATAAGLDPAAASGTFAFTADATPDWIAHTTGSAVGLNTTLASTDLDNFIAADTDGLLTFIVYLGELTNGSEDFFFSTKEGALAPYMTFPNASDVDLDGDGLGDGWETAVFGSTTFTNDPNADLDTDDGTITGTVVGDGFTNAQEEAAGSNPLVIASVPGDVDGDGLNDLWEDTNFGDGDGTPLSTELELQDGTGDPDNDWGTNEDEETAGTNPNDRASFLDDDGGTPDGQNDWWEIQYFGDTSTSTAGTDNPDGDSADNDAEYAAYSNPNLASSVPGDIDSDGVPDLWEDQYYGNNDGIIVDTAAGAADLTGTDGTADDDMDGFTDLVESNAVPVPSNPFDANSVPDDADGDNLSDDWEDDYFADIYAQDGNDDSDNDYYTNEEEENLGTNPADNSYPEFVDSDGDTLNDRFELKYWGSLTGTEDPFDDADTDDGTPTGTVIGDTYFNEDEYFAGSDPLNAASVPGDIDGDGLIDDDPVNGGEIQYWGNVWDFDENDDPDRDFSTNAEEVAAMTDPTNRASSPDSDGDGLGDGWEMYSFGTLDGMTTGSDDPLGDNDSDGYDNGTEYAAATNGSDPLSTPDTDGDGLPEGWELNYFADAAGQNGSDDSDLDGASNQLEFLAGTDPSDNASTPNPAIVSTAIGQGADTALSNDTQGATTGPDAIHGADVGVQARDNRASRLWIPMFRIDVSGLSGDLSNAALKINTTFANPASGGTIEVFGLVDGDAGENWDEATTNYNNAPGIIESDRDINAIWARDPQRFRRLGTITVGGAVGSYLSSPDTLDLESFLADDTDGVVTLALRVPSNRWYGVACKETSADEAPAIVAPTGTLTLPSDPAVDAVAFDAATNTFSITLSGLGIGQPYHVTSSTDLSAFSVVVGSGFTAASDPEVISVTADETADPAQFFRVVDGAEPAP